MLKTEKPLATAKLLIRKNFICCLKNQEIFSQSEHRVKISQLHDNANKKPQKMKVLYLGSNENKNSEKKLSKIEARLKEN